MITKQSLFVILFAFLVTNAYYAFGEDQRSSDDDSNPKYCCGPINHGAKRANVASVWNSPVQIQLFGADDRYWVSSCSSQNFTFPGLFGFPFPDDTGLQTYYVLRQLESTAGTIGLPGRQSFVQAHMNCINITSCPGQMTRYESFVSGLPMKPTLAYLYSLTPQPPQVLNTFQAAGDVIAFNKSAVDPRTGCVPRVRALDSPIVPNDPYASDGIQTGDTIYTSIVVAANLMASVSVQTTQALSRVESIINQAGGSRRDFIMVYVYLRNIADKPAMDVAYANFFAALSNLPTRVVQGAIISVRPQHANALVFIRVIARTPPTSKCDNPISYFSLPEILHDPPTLTSQAIGLGRFVYVGSVVGDTNPDFPVQSIPVDPSSQYRAALDNLEAVANTAGADRADLGWLESDLPSLLLYQPSIDAVVGFYNWTNFAPPAVNFDAGVNAYNVSMQINGIFWRNDNNYAILPSPWPWAIDGLLADQILGLPIGTVRNDTFCSGGSLVTCPKPGFFFNSYPQSPFNSLGFQTDPDATFHQP